jgi:hypothetical protein
MADTGYNIKGLKLWKKICLDKMSVQGNEKAEGNF